MEPKQITWVKKSRGALADFAVLAGLDSGRKVYVARANIDGLMPGKLHSGQPYAHIPFHGEQTKVDYEVLVAPEGALSWVEAEGGKIPHNAIRGGHDPDGAPLYIGRVLTRGTLTCGKVHQRDGICYIPYDSKENNFRKYEILVRNAYGALINA